MALINETQDYVLKELEKKLNEYNNEDKHVNIHIHTHSMFIRNCIIPAEIQLNNDGLTIEQSNFIIGLIFNQSEEFEIVYVEEENSYYLRCDDCEIYFDFIS